MSNEQAAPDTNGVGVEFLASVDLGPEIEGMAGRQLRMRMVTIELESLRTMGREWAGRRIGTQHTGLRTEDRFRRWRSRSISSGTSSSGPTFPVAAILPTLVIVTATRPTLTAVMVTTSVASYELMSTPSSQSEATIAVTPPLEADLMAAVQAALAE